MGNFTKNKNTVSTPDYIAEFLTDYLECQGKKCLDPTAGVGSLLQYCDNAFGIEFIPSVYDELRNKDPKGTYINASVFDSTDWLKEQDFDVVLMNPPFNSEKASMPAEYQAVYGSKGQDATKGLYFVEFVADAVNRGMLAAIVPVGSVADGKYQNICKTNILRHHTLRTVILLNSDLFYPAASVQAVCLILELGVPHNGNTQFVDFRNDNMVKDRTRGLIDKNGTWNEKRGEWKRILQEKPHQPEQKDGCITSVIKTVSGEDNWDPKSHFVYDTRPTEEDFYKTVKDYLDFQIKQKGLAQYLREHPELLPPKQVQLQRISQRIVQLQAIQARLALEIVKEETSCQKKE